MNDENLTFADGTETVGRLIETESRLFLYIYGLTMTEVFNLLIVPENTKTIKWESFGNKGKVTGYRHLMSVSEETGGMISASLKKN